MADAALSVRGVGWETVAVLSAQPPFTSRRLDPTSSTNSPLDDPNASAVAREGSKARSVRKQQRAPATNLCLGTISRATSALSRTALPQQCDPRAGLTRRLRLVQGRTLSGRRTDELPRSRWPLGHWRLLVQGLGVKPHNRVKRGVSDGIDYRTPSAAWSVVFRSLAGRSREGVSHVAWPAAGRHVFHHCDTLVIVPPDHSRVAVEPPDLPELEPRQLDNAVQAGRLVLDGALVEHQGLEPVRADRVVVTESELRGVAIDAENAPGLRLSDVVLRACDLSNMHGREGSLRRVEIYDSRLVGFGLTGGAVQDLRVVDSSLALGSFASSTLRDVVFERVDLAEASFMQAQLETVAFIDCKLVGSDFRGVKMKGCTIRGTSLDGILGVD
jgi:uncharacterized protein YjbI with pentapeptide repeats